MHENLIFLSYRRTDTAPYTLALKLELEDQLRAANVFVDTHHIQGADRWDQEIEVALRMAKVVIPIIGHTWVGPISERLRRIDNSEDWVRRELEFALKEKANAVLPLLVDGTPPLNPETLPPGCRDITKIQAIEIDLNSWDISVGKLVSALTHRFGFERKQTQFKYPKPNPLIARTIAIPWSDLELQISTFLPMWAIEFSDDEKRLHHKRVELTRTFEFSSFSDAMKFISSVAEHADRIQHHPRWMNVWRSVKIYLTTWDAGHRVTALDIEFARYLDRIFRRR
jgi:pterin-4a-carbinolamine dehydratase